MGKRPDRFEETVLLLAGKLRNRCYAFRGTVSLVLQGLDMNVDDIDILADQKTALASNRLLKEFLVKKTVFSQSDRFKSFFGQFCLNDVPVEVMGNWQIKDLKGNWSRVYKAAPEERKEIDLQGKRVFVTTIETEIEMFTKMGRWQALNKIKKQWQTRQQQSLF